MLRILVQVAGITMLLLLYVIWVSRLATAAATTTTISSSSVVDRQPVEY